VLTHKNIEGSSIGNIADLIHRSLDFYQLVQFPMMYGTSCRLICCFSSFIPNPAMLSLSANFLLYLVQLHGALRVLGHMPCLSWPVLKSDPARFSRSVHLSTCFQVVLEANFAAAGTSTVAVDRVFVEDGQCSNGNVAKTVYGNGKVIS